MSLSDYWGGEIGADDLAPLAPAPPLPAPGSVPLPPPDQAVYVPPDLPTAPQATPAPPLPSPGALAPAPLRSAGWRPRTRTGATVLMLGTGAAAGAWLGGAWGAGAGVLLLGAARNVWRASRRWGDPDPAVRDDAVKSGTVGLLGAGIGAFLAYKAYQSRKG